MEMKTGYKECPYCKKSVVDIASDCECGYRFKESEKKSVTITSSNNKKRNYVTIEDIHMPFGSMVEFMIKWAIASIPAMIILFLLGFLISAILGISFFAFN